VTSLSDRLRGVIGPPKGVATGSGPPEGGPYNQEEGGGHLQVAHAQAVAEVLDGTWCESRGQRFLVIDRKYGPGHRHGRVAIADSLPPSSGLWPNVSLLSGACPERAQRVEGCPPNLLFMDLETTGLAGGAGTYAFLVGCAWFDSGCLRTRQFFLSSFAAERAMLEALADVAEGAGTVVTYNGKTFDVPLIETRFLLQRMQTPFAGMPHIDMLHPARRLWRSEHEGQVSCRLSLLERLLCGEVREGDVPGMEIPSRYFHYVRSGDARPLAAVFEHNRLDLLSLAIVTARAAQLLEDGPPAATTTREAYGLGRLYERAGRTADARACFARAAGIEGDLRADAGTQPEALRAYAVLSRRERRYEEAAVAWRRLVELRACPAPIGREAIEALAIHHEHRLRDLRAARSFALQSLDYPGSPSRRDAVHHRLARLDRKIDAAVQYALPLQSAQAALF
jgi:uncharacterized protein YprB with RNaseH-like and TPR domain